MHRPKKRGDKHAANNRVRQIALYTMATLLREEYKDAEENGGMSGDYKRGYLMGMSDAIETIQDRTLTPKLTRT